MRYTVTLLFKTALQVLAKLHERLDKLEQRLEALSEPDSGLDSGSGSGNERK